MTATEAGGEVALDAIADAIDEPWKPRDVAHVDETSVRMVRLEGDFPWHHHEEDELFLGWRGIFRIEMEGRASIQLEPGELYCVRAGQRQRPVADVGPAYALLIERSETKQYGDGDAR